MGEQRARRFAKRSRSGSTTTLRRINRHSTTQVHTGEPVSWRRRLNTSTHRAQTDHDVSIGAIALAKGLRTSETDVPSFPGLFLDHAPLVQCSVRSVPAHCGTLPDSSRESPFSDCGLRFLVGRIHQTDGWMPGTPRDGFGGLTLGLSLGGEFSEARSWCCYVSVCWRRTPQPLLGQDTTNYPGRRRGYPYNLCPPYFMCWNGFDYENKRDRIRAGFH